MSVRPTFIAKNRTVQIDFASKNKKGFTSQMGFVSGVYLPFATNPNDAFGDRNFQIKQCVQAFDWKAQLRDVLSCAGKGSRTRLVFDLVAYCGQDCSLCFSVIQLIVAEMSNFFRTQKHRLGGP